MEALPTTVVALFTALFADVAVLLVSPYLGTGQVAVFAVCLKLAFLIGFAVQLVQQLVLPDAADAYARGDRLAVRGHIGRANVIGTAVSVTAAGVLVVAGAPILALFGEGFARGRTCLAIVALSQVVRAMSGPAAHMLTLAGAQRTSVAVCALSLGILAAMNAGLAPRFGLAGAAAAVMITTVVWCLWLAALAWRRAGVDTTSLRPMR
jgi:O-antigen/teichoic acid export membrane protein